MDHEMNTNRTHTRKQFAHQHKHLSGRIESVYTVGFEVAGCHGVMAKIRMNFSKVMAVQ